MLTEQRGAFGSGKFLIPSCIWLLTLAVAVYPAAINGFPLLFDDSNVYVAPLKWQWPGHPPFYALFVSAITRLSTLLAVPVVQAFCVIVTLELALKGLAPGSSVSLRALSLLGLMLLTQLPWLVSWIMPDLFGGLGIVAVIALLMRPEPLSHWHTALLTLMGIFAALSATANVLVLLPLAFVCLLVRSFWLGWRTPRSLSACVLIFSISVVALPVAWNAIRFDSPRLNVGGNALLFSKLVDAGLAQRYLAEKCPDIGHPICPYGARLRQIPNAQTFLWDGDPPLAEQLDAWRDPEGSFGTLARSIALEYPQEIAILALTDTLELAGRVTLGFEHGELQPNAAASVARDAVASFHADHLPRSDGARQQRGELAPYYPQVYYVIAIVASYSAILVILTLAALRRQNDTAALMLLFAAAILVSLIVHGGLVGPYPRYHVKVSWLATFALFMHALRHLSHVKAGHLRAQKPA